MLQHELLQFNALSYVVPSKQAYTVTVNDWSFMNKDMHIRMIRQINV
jgi:hypothetical protein